MEDGRTERSFSLDIFKNSSKILYAETLPHTSKKIAFLTYLLNLPYGIHVNPGGHYVTLNIEQEMNGNLYLSFR